MDDMGYIPIHMKEARGSSEFGWTRFIHFRKSSGSSVWNTDLIHERYPAGVTHFLNAQCRMSKSV